MAGAIHSTIAPELRAFDILADLPPGCILHLQPDDSNWPHVRSGEFAVVDPGARSFAVGEFFLMRRDWADRFKEGYRDRAIFQLRRGTGTFVEAAGESLGADRGVYDAGYCNPGRHEFGARPQWLAERWTSGISAWREYLEARIFGRVIGIYQPCDPATIAADALDSPPAAGARGGGT